MQNFTFFLIYIYIAASPSVYSGTGSCLLMLKATEYNVSSTSVMGRTVSDTDTSWENAYLC